MPKLIITQPVDKSDEDYQQKYCHPRMHPKNYASRLVVVVDAAKLAALRKHEAEAVHELRSQLSESGISGAIKVQQAAGGLGKKRLEETREHYLARRPVYGMPTILEMEI